MQLMNVSVPGHLDLFLADLKEPDYFGLYECLHEWSTRIVELLYQWLMWWLYCFLTDSELNLSELALADSVLLPCNPQGRRASVELVLSQ